MLDEQSLTKRTRASNDIQTKDGPSIIQRNSKLDSLNFAPETKKMKKRVFHTTAHHSVGKNWMNSSMTVESSHDRYLKGKSNTKFMNDIINKSIDVPIFDNTNQNSLAEPNLIGSNGKQMASGENTTVRERTIFGKLGGADSSGIQLGNKLLTLKIYMQGL